MHGTVHTGIGVGHHDAGLENLFNKISGLHRDGFMSGTMIAFRAAAGGIDCEETATAFQRLMYSYTVAHTAHTAIFGEVMVEIFSFGPMPSGIWLTGILNSIMMSLGVILGGASYRRYLRRR